MRRHLGKVGRGLLLFLTLASLGLAISHFFTGQAPARQLWQTHVVTPCMVWMHRAMPTFSAQAPASATENDLQMENALLQAKLEAVDDIFAENERLRALYALKPLQNAEIFTECAVLGRRVDGWQATLTLGKGSAEGVQTGDLAVCPQGVVGIVETVSPTTCTLRTLLDPACQIAGKLANSAQTTTYGMAQGDLAYLAQGQLVCEVLSTTAPVLCTEKVVTADLQTYPPNLPLGTVTRVYDRADGLAQIAVLTPAVDIMQVQTVYLLHKEGI